MEAKVNRRYILTLKNTRALSKVKYAETLHGWTKTKAPIYGYFFPSSKILPKAIVSVWIQCRKYVCIMDTYLD